ncbi:uncharacterized protein K452DRAFT_282004 [Aplosporella prunicola CBS 121167]|uniref:Uncharacterized protein n=1 Tax=Aplosporella prunicola CBS 121167 TaxID=1176127 RepID=A0A6A6BWD5_9PEZI|nr:uncharacterized protein K452DRAFT_282004 [Aplosporella prunicola CBS 121167]KAF2147021.1 hypothetical protein K452DRAFT_282004 [Aplosporella prunicola CBS 121167]
MEETEDWRLPPAPPSSLLYPSHPRTYLLLQLFCTHARTNQRIINRSNPTSHVHHPSTGKPALPASPQEPPYATPRKEAPRAGKSDMSRSKFPHPAQPQQARPCFGAGPRAKRASSAERAVFWYALVPGQAYSNVRRQGKLPRPLLLGAGTLLEYTTGARIEMTAARSLASRLGRSSLRPCMALARAAYLPHEPGTRVFRYCTASLLRSTSTDTGMT